MRARHLAAGLLLTFAMAACGGPSAGAKVVAAPPSAVPVAAVVVKDYTVGVRHVGWRRGADRPLPTTIWYPEGSGRFPIVLFSHGLHGMPSYYEGILTRWAAAGFVVVAPAYPYTSDKATRFDRSDVRNQPADATYVIAQVVALDARTGDGLSGHLEVSRVAAAGHSAGGYTTLGLFTGRRDARIGAGIVIAGGRIGDAGFVGPAAPILFVHGDADPTVSYATGRAAYDRVPWPKAFLTLIRQGHGAYLGPGMAGFDQTVRTTVDFLRWTLKGDAEARGRIRQDGTKLGVSTLSDRL